MTDLEMDTGTIKKLKRSFETSGFYSVEFAVDKPHPLYQFKIWRSETNPMFVVVKDSSEILSKLEAGRVLNMTFYAEDKEHPKRRLETRIGPINDWDKGRFRGHCTIDLVPVDPTCNN